MTRLADALRRANSGHHDGPKPEPAIPPAAAPHEPAPRAVISRPGEGPTPITFGGNSLIAAPSRHDELTRWRTDPEAIGKLLGTEGFSGAALEQYRKLAATLHHSQVERGTRVVMTASALPGEGKSLTAVNLALTLSESYHRRVFLIDADLRRPSIQRLFGLPAVSGLNEGLKADQDRPMPIMQVSERLSVLAAGRPESDPMSGLTSDRMRRLIAQAAAAFDWVILDTPPVGLLPDANLLAANVDGVLLVVRSRKAPFALVKRTVDAVGHDRIMGVIMNAVDYKNDRNAGGYYEYYGYGYYGVPKK